MNCEQFKLGIENCELYMVFEIFGLFYFIKNVTNYLSVNLQASLKMNFLVNISNNKWYEITQTHHMHLRVPEKNLSLREQPSHH